MTNLVHSRQQWAVGQGFFHTASIEIEGTTYRYIYDCGSQDQRTVNNEVDRYFTNETLENEEARLSVDMLVISHFHADHINGIPHLLTKINLKQLVVPYLSPEQKLLALAQLADQTNEMEFNELSGLIVNPNSLINNNDIQIIEIVSDGGNPFPDTSDGVDLQGGQYGHTKLWNIKNNSNIFWQFKFYVENGASLAQQIKNELKGVCNGSSINECLTAQNYNHFKEIFNGLGTAKQNKTNLSMYSGPANGLKYYHTKPNNYSDCFHCCFSYWKFFGINTLGWLGTGDAELKSASKFNQFESHFGHLLLETVDTLSIPHHGSKDNYHPKLADIGFRHVITANAETGKHHPSITVTTHLQSRGSQISVATKEPNKALFDVFNIAW